MKKQDPKSAVRPSAIWPDFMQQELLRLYQVDPEWVQWEPLDGQRYKAFPRVRTWLSKAISSGADAFSLWAASVYLGQGPKVFLPSVEHQEALANVEVKLTLSEYAQPYPALLVVVDVPPFTSVLCHKSNAMLTCCLHSSSHEFDITTTIAVDGRPIEVSLQHYDDDCAELGKEAGKALRIAINSCLCLVNYGCHLDYLFSKEVERDQELAKEKSPRGEKACGRLALAVQSVSFDKEIALHKVENQSRGEAATGRQVSSHWRRGHWAMQPCGPQNSQRKRILRKPVLVRADLFVGDLKDTGATYKK